MEMTGQMPKASDLAMGDLPAFRVETVSASGRALSAGQLELLAARQSGGSCCGGAHLAGLSPREREAFFHLVAGKTIRELAGTMSIQLKTAENYRCRVLQKIHARNAAEAVHYAVRHGLLVASGVSP